MGKVGMSVTIWAQEEPEVIKFLSSTFSNVTLKKCDQIKRNFAIWAKKVFSGNFSQEFFILLGNFGDKFFYTAG